MSDQATLDAVADAVDADRLVDLLRRSVQTRSITKEEHAYATLLQDEMRAAGFDDVELFDFGENRPNVVGRLRGTGGGKRLMFLGHTDTVHVAGWAEHWAGTWRQDPFGGAVEAGIMTGRGVADQKAGIVAAIGAMEAIRAAGYRPKGDVTGLFVGDEESGEPDSGYSDGIKACVARIRDGSLPGADFAVYTEPTTLQIYAAQMGFLTADVTVKGESAYFGRPWLGKDAIRDAHRLLERLWALSAKIWERATHPLMGRGFLLVTGIQGGGYIAVPGECTITFIRKILPGDDLDTVRDEIDDALRTAAIEDGIRTSITYTAPRDHPVGGKPAETPEDTPEVEVLQELIRRVRPDRGTIEGAPYWSEMSFLQHQLGIPTVYCAPGDISHCHTPDEHIDLDEVVQAAQIFAQLIAEVCGLETATP